MYRLMVSPNAGCHYQLHDQDESLEELKKRARKYDEQGLPWTIDDENGKPVEFPQIHKQIIDSIRANITARVAQAIDFVMA